MSQPIDKDLLILKKKNILVLSQGQATDKQGLCDAYIV